MTIKDKKYARLCTFGCEQHLQKLFILKTYLMFYHATEVCKGEKEVKKVGKLQIMELFFFSFPPLPKISSICVVSSFVIFLYQSFSTSPHTPSSQTMKTLSSTAEHVVSSQNYKFL